MAWSAAWLLSPNSQHRSLSGRRSNGACHVRAPRWHRNYVAEFPFIRSRVASDFVSRLSHAFACSTMRRGRGLKAGEFVMTGSIADAIWVAAGDVAVGTIDGLGSVTARF